MFVKYASHHCCRLMENYLHNTKYIELFDDVKHGFFQWRSVNRFVCFVLSVITQSCHSVVTMTLTKCEIPCWFFMNLTAWGKLVSCLIVINFLTRWPAIGGKSCNLFFSNVIKMTAICQGRNDC